MFAELVSNFLYQPVVFVIVCILAVILAIILD